MVPPPPPGVGVVPSPFGIGSEQNIGMTGGHAAGANPFDALFESQQIAMKPPATPNTPVYNEAVAPQQETNPFDSLFEQQQQQPIPPPPAAPQMPMQVTSPAPAAVTALPPAPALPTISRKKATAAPGNVQMAAPPPPNAFDKAGQALQGMARNAYHGVKDIPVIGNAAQMAKGMADTAQRAGQQFQKSPLEAIAAGAAGLPAGFFGAADSVANFIPAALGQGAPFNSKGVAENIPGIKQLIAGAPDAAAAGEFVGGMAVPMGKLAKLPAAIRGPLIGGGFAGLGNVQEQAKHGNVDWGKAAQETAGGALIGGAAETALHAPQIIKAGQGATKKIAGNSATAEPAKGVDTKSQWAKPDAPAAKAAPAAAKGKAPSKPVLIEMPSGEQIPLSQARTYLKDPIVPEGVKAQIRESMNRLDDHVPGQPLPGNQIPAPPAVTVDGYVPPVDAMTGMGIEGPARPADRFGAPDVPPQSWSQARNAPAPTEAAPTWEQFAPQRTPQAPGVEPGFTPPEAPRPPAFGPDPLMGPPEPAGPHQPEPVNRIIGGKEVTLKGDQAVEFVKTQETYQRQRKQVEADYAGEPSIQRKELKLLEDSYHENLKKFLPEEVTRPEPVAEEGKPAPEKLTDEQKAQDPRQNADPAPEPPAEVPRYYDHDAEIAHSQLEQTMFPKAFEAYNIGFNTKGGKNAVHEGKTIMPTNLSDRDLASMVHEFEIEARLTQGRTYQQRNKFKEIAEALRQEEVRRAVRAEKGLSLPENPFDEIRKLSDEDLTTIYHKGSEKAKADAQAEIDRRVQEEIKQAEATARIAEAEKPKVPAEPQKPYTVGPDPDPVKAKQGYKAIFGPDGEVHSSSKRKTEQAQAVADKLTAGTTKASQGIGDRYTPKTKADPDYRGKIAENGKPAPPEVQTKLQPVAEAKHAYDEAKAKADAAHDAWMELAKVPPQSPAFTFKKKQAVYTPEHEAAILKGERSSPDFGLEVNNTVKHVGEYKFKPGTTAAEAAAKVKDLRHAANAANDAYNAARKAVQAEVEAGLRDGSLPESVNIDHPKGAVNMRLAAKQGSKAEAKLRELQGPIPDVEYTSRALKHMDDFMKSSGDKFESKKLENVYDDATTNTGGKSPVKC